MAGGLLPFHRHACEPVDALTAGENAADVVLTSKDQGVTVCSAWTQVGAPLSPLNLK
jgi:hypothetical protein